MPLDQMPNPRFLLTGAWARSQPRGIFSC